MDICANRDDINDHYIPATEIASSVGNVRVANIVMFGAYLAIKQNFSVDEAKNVLREFSKNRRNL